MGKSKSTPRAPPESCLILPPALTTPLPFLIDTHCHLLSTYTSYLTHYPPPSSAYLTLQEFVVAVLLKQGVRQVVDVWCEAPMTPGWRDVVDSLSELEPQGFSYYFVVGVHPHAAKDYDDKVETSILEAYKHPRCVGWGEIGLDYKYDNSPRDLQQQVLRSQIRTFLKVDLGKGLTIHTREADEDIFRILTEELPVSQKIHIHCYTDSPELATKLLSHFPNLFIGITGVISYSSNKNTSNVLRQCFDHSSPTPPRFLLETDSPFMVPANLPPPSVLGFKSGQKIPLSHAGMLPWTAEFIAQVLNEGTEQEERWTREKVIKVANENAAFVYGIGANASLN